MIPLLLTSTATVLLEGKGKEIGMVDNVKKWGEVRMDDFTWRLRYCLSGQVR